MHRFQYRPFFSRSRIECESESGFGFEPTEYPSLDPFLWRPVAAGVWTHRDIVEGVFTFRDLCDVHEYLDVKEKNQADFRAWRAAQEAKS